MFTDGYLAVSDLHLGISNEIGRAGITVPSQAERLAEKLNQKIWKEKYCLDRKVSAVRRIKEILLQQGVNV